MTLTLHKDHEPEPELVKTVQHLIEEAEAARADFQLASEEFAGLSVAETNLLADLLNAALRMNDAKVRMDTALAAIRRTAGMI